MIPFLSKVKRSSIIKKSFTFIRFLHEDKKAVYPLNNRGLVKVSGPDAAPFLQGLITNDMNHFEDGAQSMYAMFLNEKGRVLYDTIVHKWAGDDNTQFLLECDKSIQNVLERYLKIYQLKRKIQIEDVGYKFKLWALITFDKYDNVYESDGDYNISIFKDPRLAELGYRLITSTNMGIIGIHQAIGMDTVIRSDEEEYQALRYRLGVSEGAKDLTPGACFPLEANCDYLHGVSFHKGCYIGQELTARVHHTGVVRKRIMPIQILGIKKEEDLQADAPILSGTTMLGKFKGRVGTCGLGLVRIKEALQAKIVNIGMNSIEISKPHWWPVEATKENMSALNSEN